MEKFYELVIRHRKIIFAVFIGIAVICAMAPSTVALDVMEDEFDGGIPNARVLIYNVTVPEALSYKEKLGEIDGVTDVTWLDDTVTAKIGELAANGDQEANALYQCAATENTGINDYTSAVNKITTGYASITGGAKDLADGTATLYQGTQELVRNTEFKRWRRNTFCGNRESFKRSTFIAERSRTACRQHAYIAKRQQIISRGSGSIKGRNKRNEGRHKRAE